jgi:site-specific DNA recombinase
MKKLAAIYSRVSSDQQRESHTIASQTEAVKEFAGTRDYQVPAEWVFEDDGYSGANLLRPGLEQVRDLAASGQIEAVLVLSPDRLSRKYAYQVLLMEEFGRSGVETVFVRAPQTETPEDRLLLQFQGMIAEYERAQILERSRRGKRHRAKQGEASVLSGAPYGFQYVKKTQESPGTYEIHEPEAAVVRRIYALYTGDGLPIGAITARLNEEGIPPRKAGGRWERSTVWGILKNPAYRGTAYFGKTQCASRQRITRPVRLKGGRVSQRAATVDRPREEWIEIPVPAIVTPETFALAEERLTLNKKFSLRRTKVESLLQGLLYCKHCSYGLYRTSTRTSARTIYYYRCYGTDAYRHGGTPLCPQKPIRQDALDPIVWGEVVRLLEDPSLIENELDRRREAARQSDPSQRRIEALKQEESRLRNGMERLLTAYQEGLMSIEELRQRMPALKVRDQAVQNEVQALNAMAMDQSATLRLAEVLSSFRERLRNNAETLDIPEKRRIMKLLVKEIAVGDNAITIRHSIPVTHGPGGGNPAPMPPSNPSQPPSAGSYALRSGRDNTSLWSSCKGRVEGMTVDEP